MTRPILTRTDARFACTGLAAAIAIGLLTGAAMKPQLGVGDRPEGPQMFSFGGGARSTGPFDDGVNFTSYGANVPQYVTGTDWIAETLDAMPADEPQPADYAYAEQTAVAAWTPPVREEEPRAEVSFPSTSGGRAYGAEAAATDAVERTTTPGPPSADDPMVTGDFSPAEADPV